MKQGLCFQDSKLALLSGKKSVPGVTGSTDLSMLCGVKDCKGLASLQYINLKCTVIWLQVSMFCISLDFVWCSWIISFGTWKSIQQLGTSLNKVELIKKFAWISVRGVLNSDFCYLVKYM